MIPRFIHSGMVGAPAMSTPVSGGIVVLDAVLVTGFNIKTPTSVTVSAGVATFSYLAAHGYEDKCWVRVAGAGAAALNADHQCTVPSSTILTVPAPGVPDGPVSGSVETRVAPLGWDRPFTATDVAVYRSPNVAGTRTFFQVQDKNLSGGGYFHFRGFESMSAAEVGTNPFPSAAQAADSTPFTAAYKGSGGSWCVVGDDRTVYMRTQQGYGTYGVMSFGDFDSFKPADAYSAFVGTGYNGYVASLSSMSGSTSRYLARDAAGLVVSSPCGLLGPGAQVSGGSSRAYPGTVNGGVSFFRPPLVMDGSGSNAPVRGVMRGLLFVMENVPAVPWLIVPSVAGIDGRVLVVRDQSDQAAVAFAIDEAW